VDTTNIEFKGKIRRFLKSSFVKGHGLSIASIAAGQGDNGYGVPGVCYDCSIFSTRYGNFGNFEFLMELSRQGARVINCSWTGTFRNNKVQAQVDTMFNNGTIIVAAAGNRRWSANHGKISYYPASYDHIISVSSVMYKYEKPQDNILFESSGAPYAENIRGYLGRTMGFKDLDTTEATHIYPITITSLNKDVDLLAPSYGMFSYSKTLKNNKVTYIGNEATSPSTPLVTGTIGLMFSLYPCLPTDEVESILKMTATNIDDIEANKPYAGMYGAGMLNTGRAVEMVFDMFAEKDPVKIENQKFSRWDFKLTSLSEVVMKNQKFTENATLNLTSKKKIVIFPNTVLRPNTHGKIHIEIDPSLQKECELRLRDPSILDKN
jgi:subtilisin family serine protease